MSFLSYILHAFITFYHFAIENDKTLQKNAKNFHQKMVKTEKFGLHRNRALIGQHAKIIKNGSYKNTTLLLTRSKVAFGRLPARHLSAF